MSRYFFSGILLLIILFSCKEFQSEENLPTITQSIEFLTHKIDGKEINTSQINITNVVFKVENDKCIYKYEYKQESENIHFEEIQSFYLKDILYIGTNSFSSIYNIDVNLDKRANHRYVRSLNDQPIAVLPDEWLGKGYIRVRKSDQESILKAFRNIVKIQESNRANDYFEESD